METTDSMMSLSSVSSLFHTRSVNTMHHSQRDTPPFSSFASLGISRGFPNSFHSGFTVSSTVSDVYTSSSFASSAPLFLENSTKIKGRDKKTTNVDGKEESARFVYRIALHISYDDASYMLQSALRLNDRKKGKQDQEEFFYRISSKQL